MTDPSVVFSAEAVNGNLSAGELRTRLSVIAKALSVAAQDEESQVLQEHGPGLESLAEALVEKRIVRSSDSGVVVMGAVVLAHLLRLYAPNAPYSSASEMKTIFSLFHRVLRKHLTGDTSSSLYPHVFGLLEELVRAQSYILLIEFELHDLVLDLYRLMFELAPELGPDQAHLKPYFLSILTSLVEEADTVPQEALDEIFTNLLSETATRAPASFELATALVQNATTRLQPFVTSWMHDVLLAGKTAEYELADSAPHLVFTLYSIAPSILLYVLPQLEEHLKTEELADRTKLVKLVGNLAALSSAPGSSLYEKYPPLFDAFTDRFRDIDAGIRAAMVRMTPAILDANAALDGVVKELEPLVRERLEDASPVVRIAAIEVVAVLAASDRHGRFFTDTLLQVGSRLLDRKAVVAKAAVNSLAGAYAVYRDAFLDGELDESTPSMEWIPGSILSLLANIALSLGDGEVAFGGELDEEALRAAGSFSGVDAETHALLFEIERVFDEVLLPGGSGSGRELDAADRAETLLFVYDTAPLVARKGLELLFRQRAEFYVLLTAYLKYRLLDDVEARRATAVSNRMDGLLASLASLFVGHSRHVIRECLKELHSKSDNSVFKLLRKLMDPTTQMEDVAGLQAEFVAAAKAGITLSGSSRKAAFADVMVQMARKAANPFASTEILSVLVAQIETIRAKFASGAYDADGDEPLTRDAVRERVGGLLVSLSLTSILGRTFPYAFAGEHAVFLSLLSPAHPESDALARQVGLELLLATGMWLQDGSDEKDRVPETLLALLDTATVTEARLMVKILGKTHRKTPSAVSPFVNGLVKTAGMGGQGAWATTHENGTVLSKLALWAELNATFPALVVPHLQRSLVPFAEAILKLPLSWLDQDETDELVANGLADEVRETTHGFYTLVKKAAAGSAAAEEALNAAWNSVPSYTAALKIQVLDAFASLATGLVGRDEFDASRDTPVADLCVSTVVQVLEDVMDDETVESGHVRLAAVRAILAMEDLQYRVRLSPLLTASGAYGLVALCIQDPVFEVRKLVSRTIFDAASSANLNTKYIALLTLAVVDPERENQDAAASFLKSLVKARAVEAGRFAQFPAVHASLSPEYTLPYFIHMLAGHPDYFDDDLDHFCKYLKALIESLTAKGNNFSFVHTMLTMMLSAEDASAAVPPLTQRIYALVEMSLVILKAETDRRSWKLTPHPGQIMLPTALFRPAPQPATIGQGSTFLPPSFALPQHTTRRDIIVGKSAAVVPSPGLDRSKISRLGASSLNLSTASTRNRKRRRTIARKDASATDDDDDASDPTYRPSSKVSKSLTSPTSPSAAARARRARS